MPKETHIAARNARGEEFLYHENPYPPANVVEFFERYHKGAAGELLEMAIETFSPFGVDMLTPFGV